MKSFLLRTERLLFKEAGYFWRSRRLLVKNIGFVHI